MAFIACADRKWFVVVDGVEGKDYNAVFSAGEGRVVFDSPDRLHYLAIKGQDILLVEERFE